MNRLTRAKRALAALGFLALLGSEAGATTMVELSLDDLTHLADAIVVAEVTSVGSRWEAKPNGGRMVRTHNQMTVVESWKGELFPGQAIDVVEQGGLVDGRGFDLIGNAGYQKSERVLLFLEPRRAGGWRTIGLRQGKYTLVPNGANGWHVVRNVVPIERRGRPLDARTLRPTKSRGGDDFATMASRVKAIVEADVKAGIRGKDLPRYKGIGR